MNDDTQVDFKEVYNKTPKELQDILASEELGNKVEKISRDHKLLIDKSDLLFNEIISIFTGITKLKDFTKNIKNALEIDNGEAEKIAHDVNELIFNDLRETLKKVTVLNDSDMKGVWVPTEPIKKENPPSVEESKEIQNNLLPEIAPEAMLPATSILSPKQELYHENFSPVENIVKAKMSETVVVPKETVVVEEKAKLPEKVRPSDSTDPYREAIL